MFRRLRRLFPARRPRPPRRRPCRPQLERLEDRLNPAPAVTLTAPAGGAVLSGTAAEFFGDAVDPAGTTRAEFYVDGVLRSTDVNDTGHYHFGGEHNRFDTTAFANGPHVLRLVVYGVRTVTLTLTYDPALLDVTAAAVGAGVPAGATVTLSTPAPGTAVLAFRRTPGATPR
jgi:hypothetical protein